MPRLLVVEDDDAIAEPLLRALTREGHNVLRAASGEAALDLVMDGSRFDLVVLDIGLPGIDGFEVCRRLREHDRDLPVLMLTARSAELDEVVGLDVGADDYLTKPFSFSVLAARIRAALRREAIRDEPFEASGVRIDPASRMAWREERPLELTPKEFDLLALLVANAGIAVRRERIMSEVWDENWWGPTKTLDVHVGALRRKLGEPPVLSTVRGVGFRFEEI